MLESEKGGTEAREKMFLPFPGGPVPTGLKRASLMELGVRVIAGERTL